MSLGVVRIVVVAPPVPPPSWPESFPPQQYKLPSLSVAHVWNCPAVIVTMIAPAETGSGTCTGKDWSMVDPTPSWPTWLRPKQYRIRESSTAHVCSEPVAAATTVEPVENVISTGELWSVVPPLPTWRAERMSGTGVKQDRLKRDRRRAPHRSTALKLAAYNDASACYYLSKIIMTPTVERSRSEYGAGMRASSCNRSDRRARGKRDLDGRSLVGPYGRSAATQLTQLVASPAVRGSSAEQSTGVGTTACHSDDCRARGN